MYYEYWGLKKAPFDNVPDPSMYADCHASMESAIAETLFAIEEGEDCVAVIVGEVGLGKTMSIRMVLDSLDQVKYKIALITNPELTFVQLLREIIGQLTGKQCEEKKKVDLLEIFNKLLFETFDEGKKVLIFIDEANVITSKNLENLRLLTNMQDDERNLFTMVLVGQIELAQRLEQPKFANFFQRIGTYNKIENIQTRDLVKAYVETRLTLAGGTRKIFTEDAYDIIWKCSEYGVPRLINKICKLSLKAGETNEFNEINSEVVSQIGKRFQKISPATAPKRATRKRTSVEKPLGPINEIESGQKEVLKDQGSEEVKPVTELPDLLGLSTPFKEVEEKTEVILESTAGLETDPATEVPDLLGLSTPFKEVEEKTEVILEGTAGIETGPVAEKPDSVELPLFPEESASIEEEETEVRIGENKVKVNISPDFIKQAQSSDQEQCEQIAGVVAAQTLKENPQLTDSPSADPVPIWEEIKNFVLRKIGKK